MTTSGHEALSDSELLQEAIKELADPATRRMIYEKIMTANEDNDSDDEAPGQ